jgi:hypothetical protein
MNNYYSLVIISFGKSLYNTKCLGNGPVTCEISHLGKTLGGTLRNIL